MVATDIGRATNDGHGLTKPLPDTSWCAGLLVPSLVVLVVVDEAGIETRTGTDMVAASV